MLKIIFFLDIVLFFLTGCTFTSRCGERDSFNRQLDSLRITMSFLENRANKYLDSSKISTSNYLALNHKQEANIKAGFMDRDLERKINEENSRTVFYNSRGFLLKEESAIVYMALLNLYKDHMNKKIKRLKTTEIDQKRSFMVALFLYLIARLLREAHSVFAESTAVRE